jgi:hypothetical protein
MLNEIIIPDALNDYITDHFKWSEIVCPCCQRVKINSGLYRHMGLLESLRIRVGFPIIIRSGYRCQSHNIAIGGSDGSEHLSFATDIRAENYDESKLKTLYKEIISMNRGDGGPVWMGIGLYNAHIHIDCRHTSEPVYWHGTSV